MVSSINKNFSPRTLEYAKNELTSLASDNGEITEEIQSTLSPDAISMIRYFGNNKNILTRKIYDLITQNEAKKKQTSKEVPASMDLSLNDAQKPKNI